jgi:hypothetical protein
MKIKHNGEEWEATFTMEEMEAIMPAIMETERDYRRLAEGSKFARKVHRLLKRMCIQFAKEKMF